MVAIAPSMPVTYPSASSVYTSVESSSVIKTTNFSSVTTSSAAAASSGYLNVIINGTPYKIQLFNL
jgi:hypothetical protein